jgi:hypothetical protein
MAEIRHFEPVRFVAAFRRVKIMKWTITGE